MKYVPRRISPGGVLMFCLTLLAHQAHGVAYCALRDPVNTIYELFPEANNYRSVVRTVGRDVRQQITDDLPFELHFNELGRHTLYVAQDEAQPLGLVHARSEPGKWGLDEFVWAISLDLKIIGVKIQRTRDRQLRKFDKEAVLQLMVGKDRAALSSIYNAKLGGTKQVDAKSADPLTIEFLRSAIKTLFVTEHVWARDLKEIAALQVAQQINSNTQKVVPVARLFDDRINRALADLDMTESPVFDREALSGYRMLDSAGALMGLVVRTPFEIRAGDQPLWWVASTSGEIQYVGNPARVDEDFSHVMGYAPDHPRNCSSAIDLAALEVAVLARNQ